MKNRHALTFVQLYPAGYSLLENKPLKIAPVPVDASPLAIHEQVIENDLKNNENLSVQRSVDATVSTAAENRNIKQITVVISGRPQGAKVLDALTGKILTSLPGSFYLPQSEAKRKIRVTKAGYFSKTILIVPFKNMNRKIDLRPKAKKSRELPSNPFLK